MLAATLKLARPKHRRYVPICLPAFSAANCFREEGADAAPPAHDKHEEIFHLVQKHLWEVCKASGETYFPPTYPQDGFTHATADPSKLLAVANYFYQDVVGEWLCLRMTRASLSEASLTLKFEDPSPVGNKKALTTAESGGERFPHIYGGIPPAGVVVQEYVVRRGAGGEYLSIDGLCEAAPAEAAKRMPAAVSTAVGKLGSLLTCSASTGCACAVGVVIGLALAKVSR